MSEFLLELFCEEIPARMQVRAEADLARLIGDHLKAAGLAFEAMRTFSGPRRIGLVADGLPEKTEAVREERKGPRVGAPEKAVEGFLRGAGLDSLDQCEMRADKKGEYYVALIEKPGRAADEVIAEAVEHAVKTFPWPKSMKYGEGERAQRWVRPLHRIIALLDGRVIPLTVFGIEAGDLTEGHRVHNVNGLNGERVFAVSSFADYVGKLRRNGVEPHRGERRARILQEAREACFEAGLELLEDDGLLDEVAGLAEHPVAILGDMDPAFLDLPDEVIALSMKVHQKYFAVRDPKTGALAAKFVMVANQSAPDGGRAIAAGASRVLSARLYDARHFWDLDRRRGLDAMAPELSKVTFHEKLFSVAGLADGIARLSRDVAELLLYSREIAEQARRAGQLSKADLVSQMVYEFPELQGEMGRYYALDAGEPQAVADAIRDHYRPKGLEDELPRGPVSVSTALAEKLLILNAFWNIREKPTGSKDPFALRRAALGVIRILLAGQLRLPLRQALSKADFALDKAWGERGVVGPSSNQFGDDLLSFFADRLKVHLKDEGVRHDVIDAVFAPRLDGTVDDDLVRVTDKARALQGFLETEDGAALQAGYTRAANILKAEEKKDGAAAGEPDAAYLQNAPEAAERALIAALETGGTTARVALAAEDYEAAMRALAALRVPVDAFFDDVTVNADDPMLRRNRLALLARIRTAVNAVADFDRLEG